MDARSGNLVSGGTTPPEEVRVWDPFVRLFHWSLVGLFTFAFLTGDEWDTAHELAGYAIAALLLARVIWGFFGSGHARFTDFVRSPATVLRYLADTIRMRAPRHLGHNPAGGAMVVALLVMIAAVCTTGWLMTTDAYWGVSWVEEVHEAAAYTAVALIALHVLGVVVASLEHRENLVRAMITGRKRAQ